MLRLLEPLHIWGGFFVCTKRFIPTLNFGSRRGSCRLVSCSAAPNDLATFNRCPLSRAWRRVEKSAGSGSGATHLSLAAGDASASSSFPAACLNGLLLGKSCRNRRAATRSSKLLSGCTGRWAEDGGAVSLRPALMFKALPYAPWLLCRKSPGVRCRGYRLS